jgi:hypothetical protein
VRTTFGAGAYAVLPAWLAVTEQSPVPTRVIKLPTLEQDPEEANATGRPELAVADTVKGGSVMARSFSGRKEMVCG